MAATDHESRLRITARDQTAGAFGSAARNAQRFAQQTTTASRQAQTALGGIGAKANEVGGAIKGMVGAIAGDQLRRAFTEFAELDRRMTRIGQTANASQADLKRAGESVRNLAKEYGVAQEEVLQGLESLVTSTGDLGKAMAMLPAVARTAHATGSQVKEIASTAQALGQNFGVAADKMERAFDILAAGGKAGMFELKDMASYLPQLLPAFEAVGYKGEEGLKRVVAMLQIVRRQTGTAEGAVAAMTDILGKMTSDETVNKMKELGFPNLREDLERVRKSGGDVVAAFVEMAMIATKGDLSKINQIFGDKESQKGLRALWSGANDVNEIIKQLGQSAGTVGKDLQSVTGDAASRIQRLSDAFTNATRSLGEFLDRAGASTGLETLTRMLEGTGREIERIQKLLDPSKWGELGAEMKSNRLDGEIQVIEKRMEALQAEIDRKATSGNVGGGGERPDDAAAVRSGEMEALKERLRAARDEVAASRLQQFQLPEGGLDEGARGRAAQALRNQPVAPNRPPGTADEPPKEDTQKKIEENTDGTNSVLRGMFNWFQRSNFGAQGEGPGGMIHRASLGGGGGFTDGGGSGGGGGMGGGGSGGSGTGSGAFRDPGGSGGGAGAGGAPGGPGGGPGGGGAPGGGGQSEAITQAYRGLRQEGLSHAQATAMLGTFQTESSFNPNAWNRKEGAGGLMQWRGDRQARLRAFAAEQGETGMGSVRTQARFAAREASGKVDAYNGRMGRRFMESRTTAEASQALKPFVRWGETGRRHQYADRFGRMSESDLMMGPGGATAGGPRTNIPAPPGGVGGVVEEQGSVARTRRLPLQDQVRAAIGDSARDLGLEARVYSGGQDRRTGFHGGPRHNHGNAGDLRLYDPVTKRTLRSTNPADRERMAEFIARSVARGNTGVGHGPGYMGAEGIHSGRGGDAVWGAGGSSRNAPAWVRDAWKRGLEMRQNGGPPPVAGAKPEAPAAAAPAAPPPRPSAPEVDTRATDQLRADLEKPIRLAFDGGLSNRANGVRRNSTRNHMAREIRSSRLRSYSDIGVA